MSEKELFRNKLYVSSPTSISIGNCTWFALDTKLVGRVEAMIEENQQLKENYKLIDKSMSELIEEKQLLKNRIIKAIHRIQLLQMDGEVMVRDLALIVRDLQGSDN